MIQPLRHVHRLTFATLAFALPAILLVSLRARREQPTQRSIASELPASAYLIQRSNRLWQKHAIATEFYGDSADMQTFYVVLQSSQPLNEPDPLLYWSTAEASGDSLPAQARLIGAFIPGKALPLRVDGTRSGRLFLYSGAHRAIVDASLVEKLP